MGAVFAEKFNRTIRDFPESFVFQPRVGNWIDVLHVTTKLFYNGKHSSTKLTPNQGSLEKNEGVVYHKLLDKRK